MAAAAPRPPRRSPPAISLLDSRPGGAGCSGAVGRPVVPARAAARPTSSHRSRASGPRRPPTARRGTRTTAGRCLDTVGAADCAGTDAAALVALLNTCDDTWIGAVPPGGACMTYASCAELPVSGGASAGAKSRVNSMCVPVVRQPVGATCDNTTFVCNPLEGGCAGGRLRRASGPGSGMQRRLQDGSRCTNNVCAALLGMGAACAANSAPRQRQVQRRQVRVRARGRRRTPHAALSPSPVPAVRAARSVPGCRTRHRSGGFDPPRRRLELAPAGSELRQPRVRG